MALRLPAIDQFGQVIDVLVSARRDADAAHRFFERAIGTTKLASVEVVPIGHRRTHRCSMSCSQRRGIAPTGTPQPRRMRPRPAEGPTAADARAQQDRSARTVIAGHALVQNLRRGHHELAVEAPVNRRVAVAFDELAL
jgi:transposase-like protein